MEWKEIIQIIMAIGVATANAIGLHIKYGKTCEQKKLRKLDRINKKLKKHEKGIEKCKKKTETQ